MHTKPDPDSISKPAKQLLDHVRKLQCLRSEVLDLMQQLRDTPDEVIDEVLKIVASGREYMPFISLWAAVQSARRPIQADRLPDAVTLMPEPSVFLCGIPLYVGNVVGAVLTAVRERGLSPGGNVAGLVGMSRGHG